MSSSRTSGQLPTEWWIWAPVGGPLGVDLAHPGRAHDPQRVEPAVGQHLQTCSGVACIVRVLVLMAPLYPVPRGLRVGRSRRPGHRPATCAPRPDRVRE